MRTLLLMWAFAGVVILAVTLTGIALLLLLGPTHPFWPRAERVVFDAGRPLAVLVATGAACVLLFGVARLPASVTASLVLVVALAIFAALLLRRQ